VPNSVIVGPLRLIEAKSFILGGNLRVFLSPGVPMPDYPLGTSLTVVAVSREDMLYAESIRQTPADR
jgi:hypothetical protein